MSRRACGGSMIGLGRGLSSQRRLRPHEIAMFDPGADPGARLAAGLEDLEIHAFALERKPQPLDHDVARPAALAVHGDLHAGVFAGLGEGQGGELAALGGAGLRRATDATVLLAIVILGPAVMAERLLQSRNAPQPPSRRHIPIDRAPRTTEPKPGRGFLP